MFIFSKCIVLDIVLLVCSVDNIRWLVNVLCKLIFMVFWLCILFIMMILGFWWRVVCSIFEKLSLIWLFICIWLIFGKWYLIGFFMVIILCCGLLSLFNVLYSVVVLFDFVGFVIRIMLCGCCNRMWIWFSNGFGMLVLLSVNRFVDWLSKCMIIVLFDWIGMVDKCILIWCFLIFIWVWLFWGKCFLEIFRLVISLRCSISVVVILCFGMMVFCKMLLMCWWMCSCCLLGFIWMFEVFVCIVFLKIDCNRCVMVVFCLLVRLVVNLNFFLLWYLLVSFWVNEVILLVWW